MPLYIQETYVNGTENHIIGETPVYETWADTPGELFSLLQREYGRCTGKVYIDGPDGEAIPVGWVFCKKQTYSDSPAAYTAETWVTVHTEEDEIVRHRHLFNIQIGKPLE